MATKGIIPFSSVPGWPSPHEGLIPACEAALGSSGYITLVSTGFETSDTATVNSIFSSYIGGSTQLSFVKAQKLAALDTSFDANFDLAKFIRGGTVTNVSAANVGTFISTITNNYRSLRASINSAATVAAVNAINIGSGWPSNP